MREIDELNKGEEPDLQTTQELPEVRMYCSVCFGIPVVVSVNVNGSTLNLCETCGSGFLPLLKDES